MDYTTTFGLQLTIEYVIAAADPSVGIMSPYCEKWYVTHIGSHKLGPKEKAQWLYDTLDRTGDNKLILEKLLCRGLTMPTDTERLDAIASGYYVLLHIINNEYVWVASFRLENETTGATIREALDKCIEATKSRIN